MSEFDEIPTAGPADTGETAVPATGASDDTPALPEPGGTGTDNPRPHEEAQPEVADHVQGDASDQTSSDAPDQTPSDAPDELPSADAGDADGEVAAEPPPPSWTRYDVAADREAALSAAQLAVAAGECIVLPTDTVYGIGVGAFSAEAVRRLLEAKRRGRDMPPPVLIAEPAMLAALATSVSAGATSLAEAHWPGPLTLILTAHPSLRMDLGDTGGTIAVRVPDHEFTRELLRRTGPLAVSSANTSGNPASTTIDAAIDQLGNSVSVYLDAGPTPDDAPSTIVDFSSTTLGRVVRNGALTLEELRATAPHVAGVPVLAEEDEEPTTEDADDAGTPGAGTAPVAEVAGEVAMTSGEQPESTELDEAATYSGAGAAAPDAGVAGQDEQASSRPTPDPV